MSSPRLSQEQERLFVRFYELGVLDDMPNAEPPKWESSEVGREQFVAHQSRGVVPGTPDPYYKVLTGGKWTFDLLCRELEQQYVRDCTIDIQWCRKYPGRPVGSATKAEARGCWRSYGCRWFGIYALWEDWKGDRWVLPHLLKWYKRVTGFTPPGWWAMEGEWDDPEIQEARAQADTVLKDEWAARLRRWAEKHAETGCGNRVLGKEKEP
jgi:hypothetical protein